MTYRWARRSSVPEQSPRREGPLVSPARSWPRRFSRPSPPRSFSIGVGAISLLSVVTLRDDLAASIGADGTSLDIAGRTLVAIHDWTFLLGPGFCVGVNGILLGWLMYRTGLMPPRLALLGVIGGPLIFVSSIAVLFGAYEQDGLHALFSIPEGAFEAGVCDLPDRQGLQASPILDDARFTGGDGGSLRPAAAP